MSVGRSTRSCDSKRDITRMDPARAHIGRRSPARRPAQHWARHGANRNTCRIRLGQFQFRISESLTRERWVGMALEGEVTRMQHLSLSFLGQRPCRHGHRPEPGAAGRQRHWRS